MEPWCQLVFVDDLEVMGDKVCSNRGNDRDNVKYVGLIEERVSTSIGMMEQKSVDELGLIADRLPADLGITDEQQALFSG